LQRCKAAPRPYESADAVRRTDRDNAIVRYAYLKPVVKPARTHLRDVSTTRGQARDGREDIHYRFYRRSILQR